MIDQMITKEDLLKKYNISEEFFEDADISWEDLECIYDDFLNKKSKKYAHILAEFQRSYLEDTEKAGIHSYRTRLKDAEHLIVKIIRKKKENYKKYRGLTKDNYEKFLTDLIGIRCFVLFKEQWEKFHSYIIRQFVDDPEQYIYEPVKDFDSDERHQYIAEPPKAHIRAGDSRHIYENILPPDCIYSDKIYRSVHYIIKYHGVYLEIQVRTLFEEGWGEVEHELIYPYYREDPMLNQFSELLNRLAGLADEMGSFFCKLKQMRIENLNRQTSDSKRVDNLRETSSERPKTVDADCFEGKAGRITGQSTLEDCLNEVVKE